MHKQFTGVMLILLGVLVLLQSLGLFNFGLSLFPVILVWIGLDIAWGSLVDRKDAPSFFGAAVGLLLAGVGLDRMLADVGLVAWLSMKDLLRFGGPVLLVALGLSILFGRRALRREHPIV